MFPASVNDLVNDDLRLVEERMLQHLDDDSHDLKAALLHTIRSGGKRIRPILTLLTGQMLGASKEQILNLAAGIEMLHTATLVHDDLIDGALLRRGNPTPNAHWSPAATVLSGDYLFARAADLVARSDSLPAMRLFAATLATIVSGEVGQLFSKDTEKCAPDRAAYFRRIEAKTAALFRTSAMVAGLVSPAAEGAVTEVGRYGYGIGMAFQITDDVLDFTGDPVQVGKPIGNDLRQGILTLPVICYRDMYPQDPYLVAVLGGSRENGCIERLMANIRQSEAIDRALVEAQTFVDGAVATIAVLPACREHAALNDLANFIVERYR